MRFSCSRTGTGLHLNLSLFSLLVVPLLVFVVQNLLYANDTVVHAFTTKQQDHHHYPATTNQLRTSSISLKHYIPLYSSKTPSTNEPTANVNDKVIPLDLSSVKMSNTEISHYVPLGAMDNTIKIRKGTTATSSGTVATAIAHHYDYFTYYNQILLDEEDDDDEELISIGTALVACALSLALGFGLGYGT
jgi:hypothetical protein